MLLKESLYILLFILAVFFMGYLIHEHSDQESKFENMQEKLEEKLVLLDNLEEKINNIGDSKIRSFEEYDLLKTSMNCESQTELPVTIYICEIVFKGQPIVCIFDYQGVQCLNKF